MTAEDYADAVDGYFNERLLPADPVLQGALDASEQAGLPSIAVAPNQGKLLQLLAVSVGARRILEIGTLGAYSTIWLGRALADDGIVCTLEADPRHAEVARGNIDRAGLSDRVEVLLGDALEVLPGLTGRGPFDFTFIDADKANIPAYFRWAVELSQPGSLIVVDNVVRAGAVSDLDSEDAAVRGVQRLAEDLRTDSSVSATTIQTIGTKGYDGFLLARVI